MWGRATFYPRQTKGRNQPRHQPEDLGKPAAAGSSPLSAPDAGERFLRGAALFLRLLSLRLSRESLPALACPYFCGTSPPMVRLLVSVVPGHSSKVMSCSDWGAALRRWRRLHSPARARAACAPSSLPPLAPGLPSSDGLSRPPGPGSGSPFPRSPSQPLRALGVGRRVVRARTRRPPPAGRD